MTTVMNTHFLYPRDPFDAKRPDDSFAAEYDAACEAGLPCVLFSHEHFEEGRFSTKPVLASGSRVVYRGWMLRSEQYAQLENEVHKQGAQLYTTTNQYLHAHHLPGWYSACVDYTAETIIVKDEADLDAALAGIDWPGYFVKDFVKSVSSGAGSLVRSVDAIPSVVATLRHYRGQIEGGLCIRKEECFLADTEDRYFVVDGMVYGRLDAIPAMVLEIASRAHSPFFSIDAALTTDGLLRLIEIGDGQVSDYKTWPLERFVQVLKACTAEARLAPDSPSF